MLDEQTTFLIAAMTNLTQAVNMIGGSSNMSFQAKSDLNEMLSEAMKNINHAATATPDPTQS